MWPADVAARARAQGVASAPDLATQPAPPRVGAGDAESSMRGTAAATAAPLEPRTSTPLHPPSRAEVSYECRCGQRLNLGELLFCAACKALSCCAPQCTSQDLDTYYCPHCLKNYHSSEAATARNRCPQCFECPECSASLGVVQDVEPSAAGGDALVEEPEEGDDDDGDGGGDDDAAAAARDARVERTGLYYLACPYCRWDSLDTAATGATASAALQAAARAQRDDSGTAVVESLQTLMRAAFASEPERARALGAAGRSSSSRRLSTRVGLSSSSSGGGGGSSGAGADTAFPSRWHWLDVETAVTAVPPPGTALRVDADGDDGDDGDSDSGGDDAGAGAGAGAGIAVTPRGKSDYILERPALKMAGSPDPTCVPSARRIAVTATEHRALADAAEEAEAAAAAVAAAGRKGSARGSARRRRGSSGVEGVGDDGAAAGTADAATAAAVSAKVVQGKLVDTPPETRDAQRNVALAVMKARGRLGAEASAAARATDERAAPALPDAVLRRPGVDRAWDQPGADVTPRDELLPVSTRLRTKRSRRCRACVARGNPGILLKPQISPLMGDSGQKVNVGQWYKKQSVARRTLPAVWVVPAVGDTRPLGPTTVGDVAGAGDSSVVDGDGGGSRSSGGGGDGGGGGGAAAGADGYVRIVLCVSNLTDHDMLVSLDAARKASSESRGGGSGGGGVSDDDAVVVTDVAAALDAAAPPVAAGGDGDVAGHVEEGKGEEASSREGVVPAGGDGNSDGEVRRVVDPTPIKVLAYDDIEALTHEGYSLGQARDDDPTERNESCVLVRDHRAWVELCVRRPGSPGAAVSVALELTCRNADAVEAADAAAAAAEVTAAAAAAGGGDEGDGDGDGGGTGAIVSGVAAVTASLRVDIPRCGHMFPAWFASSTSAGATAAAGAAE